MSEIEKMYENAGIKICKRKQGFTLKDCTDRDCKECGYYDIPQFTAEKKLEIVKMILFSTWWMNLKRLQFSEKFDEGLAQMINELWQDLTSEEKASIKNILEM